jgi:glycine/D-amino acid oxidase-like deaminating enzyme
MGAILSIVREIRFGLRSALSLLSKANDDFNKAQKRVSEPRLPDPSTTESFWQKNPLFPELVNIKSQILPISADVVIIGSGITGVSVAYTILKECEAIGITKRLVLLEARELCSGATGRNGGHIKATPYHSYPEYKARFGAVQAKKLCEFQMRHLPALLEIARREELYGAEVREVETVDVYTDDDMWRKAQGMLKELRNDFPTLAEGVEMHKATAAQEVCDSCLFEGKMVFANRLYRNTALPRIALALSATARERCGRTGL